jgi:hypothetical protein
VFENNSLYFLAPTKIIHDTHTFVHQKITFVLVPGPLAPRTPQVAPVSLLLLVVQRVLHVGGGVARSEKQVGQSGELLVREVVQVVEQAQVFRLVVAAGGVPLLLLLLLGHPLAPGAVELVPRPLAPGRPQLVPRALAPRAPELVPVAFAPGRRQVAPSSLSPAALKFINYN